MTMMINWEDEQSGDDKKDDICPPVDLVGGSGPPKGRLIPTPGRAWSWSSTSASASASLSSSDSSSKPYSKGTCCTSFWPLCSTSSSATLVLVFPSPADNWLTDQLFHCLFWLLISPGNCFEVEESFWCWGGGGPSTSIFLTQTCQFVKLTSSTGSDSCSLSGSW